MDKINKNETIFCMWISRKWKLKKHIRVEKKTEKASYPRSYPHIHIKVIHIVKMWITLGTEQMFWKKVT